MITTRTEVMSMNEIKYNYLVSSFIEFQKNVQTDGDKALEIYAQQFVEDFSKMIITEESCGKVLCFHCENDKDGITVLRSVYNWYADLLTRRNVRSILVFDKLYYAESAEMVIREETIFRDKDDDSYCEICNRFDRKKQLVKRLDPITEYSVIYVPGELYRSDIDGVLLCNIMDNAQRNSIILTYRSTKYQDM